MNKKNESYVAMPVERSYGFVLCKLNSWLRVIANSVFKKHTKWINIYDRKSPLWAEWIFIFRRNLFFYILAANRTSYRFPKYVRLHSSVWREIHKTDANSIRSRSHTKQTIGGDDDNDVMSRVCTEMYRTAVVDIAIQFYHFSFFRSFHRRWV